MIHHFCVTFCYGLAVTSGTYIAYGALSLMVEINSVFLHARQLFILTHEPKTSSRYKANALLNIGTFVACRILLLGWMTRHGYIFFLIELVLKANGPVCILVV